MNDQTAAIIAKLKALIDKSKEGIRVRIVDRAFAQLAAILILIGFAGMGTA